MQRALSLALACHCGAPAETAAATKQPQQRALESSGGFAAIGPAVNFTASTPSLERFLTRASKHSRQPLFHQGSLPDAGGSASSWQPWEQHITPFPAVVYNESWAPPLGPFRLYYAVQTDCGFVNGESKFESCHPDSCSVALATSADGISWIKPALNLCTFSGNRSSWNGINNLILCPAAATHSVNAKMPGHDCNGINILYDENPVAKDSERFKLWGAFGAPLAPMVGGTPVYMASGDGIHFPEPPVDLVQLPVPAAFKNQSIRFDCFPDFHWDERSQQYVGIARGARPGDDLGYAHSWFPQCTNPKSRIPAAVCDSNFRTFSFMTSPDLMQWTVRVPRQPATKEHQTYTTAAFRFHDVTLAAVSIFEETTSPTDFGFVRCSLMFTTNPEIWSGPWEGFGSRPGGDDLIALGEKGDFDYGLCYSAPPIVTSGSSSALLYYWGVNGEHYSPHNASFGMATVPLGRNVGIRSLRSHHHPDDDSAQEAKVAIVRTVALVCSLPRLVITADTGGAAGARIRAQVVREAEFGFENSVVVSGRNVTSLEMTFSGKDLSKFLGRPIELEFELSGDAALYSFAFAKRTSGE